MKVGDINLLALETFLFYRKHCSHFMIWLLAQNIGRVLTWISHWCRSISYLSSLLDKDDRLIRIAAGEALALIFEMGYLEKFSIATTGLSDSSNHNRIKARELAHIQGLRAKILNQVKSLSMEAGGKGSVKKDLNFQRNTFRDILEYLEVIHSLHVVSLFFFFELMYRSVVWLTRMVIVQRYRWRLVERPSAR